MGRRIPRPTKEMGALITFDDLKGHIATLRSEQPNVTVAISGFAGSGKSTLAARLARAFAISDRQVLRVDHFYAPEPRGTGLFDDYDWPVLERVLRDLHHRGRVQYRGRGFDNEVLLFDEPVPEVVIVEGIQLLRRERMHHFDVSVWIECTLKDALERARARDREQGHDAKYMKMWDTVWEPRNKEYFDSYSPDRLADVRYSGHNPST